MVVSLVSDLVLNHVADLRQEVLANDTVEVAILWGGFVLDAFCQTEPLLLCITHQRPSASLTACTGKKGKTDIGPLILGKNANKGKINVVRI